MKMPKMPKMPKMRRMQPMPKFPPLALGLSEVMVLTGHRTVGYGHALPNFDAIYDKLARRLWCSREFVKRTIYAMSYSADVDPWLKHLVETEIEAIAQDPTC